MFKVDEQMLRCYFRLEEYQRGRLRMERLLHPEKFAWAKGVVPTISPTKQIKLEELGRIDFGEEFYQRMLAGEQESRRELEALVEDHPLWPHLQPIRGFGKYLAGAFIAASGDITRTATVSSYWKGMGLDIVDGVAPRRIRGRKDVERRIPALPHVTRIGEQIRQQMLRQNSFYHELYDKHKADYHERYPDRPKMFCHKHGLRIAQKILYSCLWLAWRQCYNLPTPEPYPYAILRHDGDRKIKLEEFWTKPG